MKNTQKGFISIAAIIGIIIGALVVSGTAYVVVNQWRTEDKIPPREVSSGQSAGIKTDDDNDGVPAEVNFDTSSTVQTETSVSTGTGTTTEGTFYTDPMGKFSLRLPIGWKVVAASPKTGAGKECPEQEQITLTHKDYFNVKNDLGSSKDYGVLIVMYKNCRSGLQSSLGTVMENFSKFTAAKISGYETYIKGDASEDMIYALVDTNGEENISLAIPDNTVNLKFLDDEMNILYSIRFK